MGNNYTRESTAFTHPPINSSDWKDFDHAWQAVKVPVRCLLPLHGKLDFLVRYLEETKQAPLVPDNVMKE